MYDLYYKSNNIIYIINTPKYIIHANKVFEGAG